MKRCHSAAFTLIEILMAVVASAIILAAVYGVFSRAIHLRDQATERAREVRLRARAVAVMRDDLRGAIISGGKMGAILQTTSDTAQSSSYPGYLKFTTTTGREASSELLGDMQEIEYSIVSDGTGAGVLTRGMNRALLAEQRENTDSRPLLAGVSSMEVEFYDGTSWTDTWELADATSALPEGIRLRVHLAENTAPPIEVLVPWTTQRAIAQ